jgi:Domain of unknown function (DUF6431)
MLTVGKDASGVERELREGWLACPGCGGSVTPWGYGRRRLVFGPGGCGRWLRPRRARCSGCGVTHVLLPVDVLVRRRDEVAVIGVALAAAASGQGYRRIAAAAGRSVWTVRSWVRRFAASAERVQGLFTTVQVRTDVDPPPLVSAGSVVADAVVAIVAAAVAVGRRWPDLVPTLSPWEVACAVTYGSLLSPAVTAAAINTSSPLPIIGY